MPRKKKKEVVVSAPPRPSITPSEATKRAEEEALEKERVQTLEVARRFGVRFGVLTITVGILLIALSVYLTLTGQIVSSPEVRLAFIVVLALLGIVNTVSGLLLMGRD